MDNELLVLAGFRKRWLYHVAFAIARFLVVENRHGTSLHRETRRREAVFSLGGPGQRSTQVRGSRRGRSSQRRARRE